MKLKEKKRTHQSNHEFHDQLVIEFQTEMPSQFRLWLPMADEKTPSSSTSLKRAPISINFEGDEKRSTLPRGGPPLNGNLFPAVASYAPSSIRGLKDDEMKLWCACGLSKRQPWCDGSHSGTGIRPLKWRVPSKQQSVYLICNCKYSKSPPYCDGTCSRVLLAFEDAR